MEVCRKKMSQKQRKLVKEREKDLARKEKNSFLVAASQYC